MVTEQELIKHFEDDVLDNGNISTSKLRDILCASKRNKEIIDSIVHPSVFDELHKIINESNDKIIIEIEDVDSPFLKGGAGLVVDNGTLVTEQINLN